MEPKDKSIGVIGAALIGVGGMVGGGIFAVLGTAALQAKGGTPIAFAIAGVVAFLTSYSYAKLSVRFPSSGGTAVFLDKGFGINLFSGSMNLILWLSYLVTIALYASAFGSYASTFFEGSTPWLKHILMSASILLAAGINLVNANLVSKSESIIVIGKLILLAIVIIAGASHIETSRLATGEWAPFSALVVGGMIIFVAYEGFELIANAAEDVKNPTRTLPKAYYLCVIFVIILYIIIAMVTVGSVDAKTIAASEDYALAEAAKPALGQAGFTLVAISALLATFSAINATIYGNARLGFTLATDGELPKSVGEKRWNRPLVGITTICVISLLLVNLVDTEAIAILGSAGFLVIFAAVNYAGFRLSSEIKGNKVVCLVAAVACVGALATLLGHAGKDNPKALLVFLGLVLFAVAFENFYPKLARRKTRKL